MTEANVSHIELLENDLFLAGLADICSTASGRNVLAQLLGAWGLRKTAFHTDTATENFALGMQNSAFFLESAMIKADPENYILMLKEQTNAK